MVLVLDVEIQEPSLVVQHGKETFRFLVCLSFWVRGKKGGEIQEPWSFSMASKPFALFDAVCLMHVVRDVVLKRNC